eukprot:767282-Hanusia_phi.AAC.4
MSREHTEAYNHLTMAADGKFPSRNGRTTCQSTGATSSRQPYLIAGMRLQDDLKSNSEVYCSLPDCGAEEQYRKEKHKVVEQKRREKVGDVGRRMTSAPQDLLPNLDSTNSAALTMNTVICSVEMSADDSLLGQVLQCAIDFLSKNASSVQSQNSGNGTNGGYLLCLTVCCVVLMLSIGAEGAMGVSANDIEQESHMLGFELD